MKSCKKCNGELTRRAGQFYWRGYFFHGLVCVPCNALYDDPTDSFMAHVTGHAMTPEPGGCVCGVRGDDETISMHLANVTGLPGLYP